MTPVSKTRSNKPTRLALGLLSATVLFAQTGLSLSSDRDQELVYTADGNSTIASNNGTRVVTVRDNVFIKQGTMELRGNVAVFEYDQASSELKKVTVTGEPARFQQEPDSGEGLILGSSDTIVYLTAEEVMIDLTGNASFSQSGSQMNCARIQHNIDGGSTEMTGPCSGTLPPQAN